MSEITKNTRRSIRLKGYDYSQSGLYYVTICSENRACIFGEIVGDEMKTMPLRFVNRLKSCSII